jgi:hypothetical protein
MLYWYHYGKFLFTSSSPGNKSPPPLIECKFWVFCPVMPSAYVSLDLTRCFCSSYFVLRFTIKQIASVGLLLATNLFRLYGLFLDPCCSRLENAKYTSTFNTILSFVWNFIVERKWAHISQQWISHVIFLHIFVLNM